MYTSKKSSVQNEEDGKFPSNHVQNSTSCDQKSALRAVRMERRDQVFWPIDKSSRYRVGPYVQRRHDTSKYVGRV